MGEALLLEVRSRERDGWSLRPTNQANELGKHTVGNMDSFDTSQFYKVEAEVSEEREEKAKNGDRNRSSPR